MSGAWSEQGRNVIFRSLYSRDSYASLLCMRRQLFTKRLWAMTAATYLWPQHQSCKNQYQWLRSQRMLTESKIPLLIFHYYTLNHTWIIWDEPKFQNTNIFQNIPVIQNHICIYLKQTRVNSIWYRTTPECYILMISRHFIYNYTYLSSKVVKTIFYTVIIVPWQSRELSD